MFTTVDGVKEYTGYDVSQETIIIAQNIVEAYVGRDEIEVDNAYDKALLGKATAYQAAYISENSETVFEQTAAVQVSQFGQIISYRHNDMVSPFIAPLAVIACRRLSWRKSRTVKVGGLFSTGRSTRKASWNNS